MLAAPRGELSSRAYQSRPTAGHEREVENGCPCFSEHLVGIMENDHNSLAV